MRSLTDEQLAAKLEEPQVDYTAIREAARRLKQLDLQHLLTVSNMVETLNKSVALDDSTKLLVEEILLSMPRSNRTTSRVESIASRILRGGQYTHEDVMSIAALVVSQDA